MTIHDEISNYIQQLKEKGYEKRSIRRRRLILIDALIEEGVSRVTRRILDQYQDRKSHLKAITRLSYYQTIKLFLRAYYPKLEKYIEIPKVPEELPREIPNEEEVKVVLGQPDITRFNGIRDRVIIELFYGSGLRLGEVTALKLEDINLEKRLLRVVKGKGQKDRLVPLSKTASLWLRKYIKKVRSYYKPKEIGYEKNIKRYSYFVN